MTDITPFVHISSALQAIIEVTEKQVKHLPAHEQPAATERLSHARASKLALEAWKMEQR